MLLKHTLTHVAVKKALLIIALHGAATFDAASTEINIHRSPLPQHGPLVWGNTYTVEGNPLLGRNPSGPRAAVQINGDALVADWMLLRHRKGARELAAGVIAEHVALGVHNLATLQKPK